jgi:hypothetical protein
MTHFGVLSANIVGVLGELILPVPAVPGKPAEAGGFEPGLTGLADGFTSSFVFVVWADIADVLVEPLLWGSWPAVAVDLRVSAVQRLIAERY